MNTEQDSAVGHDRLIEIETKLAYQEDLLQSLNQVVIEQAEQIDVLQIRLKKLSEQLFNNAASNNANSQLEEAPPHY